MADTRNRTPFYGAVPTSKLNADHIFMADGSTLQEQADKKFELIEELTLTEDTALIERNLDAKLSYIFYFITASGTENAGIRVRLYDSTNNTIVNTINSNAIQSTSRFFKYALTNQYGIVDFKSTLQQANNQTLGAVYENGQYLTDDYTKISFETSNVNQPIPTSTILQIYAVRF